MDSALITIGDELLLGQVVNTNAAWLGGQLDALGLPVRKVCVVSDRQADIESALREMMGVANVIVCSGGLGPTHDDVTKDALSAVFGIALTFDSAVLSHLEAYFRRRGREMSEPVRRMALVPEGCEVIPNPIGTAPGLWLRRGGASGSLSERHVVLLPGVPYEMQAIFTQELTGRLKRLSGREIVRHRTIMTAGIGESQLSARIGDLNLVLEPGVTLAYLPSPKTGVRLRLSSRASTARQAVEHLAMCERRLVERVGDVVYGYDDERLEEVVGRKLAARGRTLGLAESCTGGLVAHRMTNVPGSSRYLVGSVVTYSNQSKIELLDVDVATLKEEGAVSEAVASQMARGVCRRFGTTDGVAITGIAGPSGGSPEKPVGTVWIAHADERGVRTQLHTLAQERELNKQLAATAALNLLRIRMGP